MKLTLYRILSNSLGTIGILFSGNKRVCFLNELPWKNNRQNFSSIPPGSYKVTHMKRSASGRYKDVYHVQNVKGRGGILIHTGNYTGDTTRGHRTDSMGCLLPASNIGVLSNQRAGLGSRNALRKIHKVTKRQTFTLEVLPC